MNFNQTIENKFYDMHKIFYCLFIIYTVSLIWKRDTTKFVFFVKFWQTFCKVGKYVLIQTKLSKNSTNYLIFQEYYTNKTILTLIPKLYLFPPIHHSIQCIFYISSKFIVTFLNCSEVISEYNSLISIISVISHF